MLTSWLNKINQTITGIMSRMMKSIIFFFKNINGGIDNWLIWCSIKRNSKFLSAPGIPYWWLAFDGTNDSSRSYPVELMNHFGAKYWACHAGHRQESEMMLDAALLVPLANTIPFKRIILSDCSFRQ